MIIDEIIGSGVSFPSEINVVCVRTHGDVAQCGHEAVGGHALASYCVPLMVTLTNMVIHQSVMSAQILPTASAAATIQTTYSTGLLIG